MEHFGTVSWGSSIKKLHYINTNTLIHPILCGEPIYSLKFCGTNMGCIFLIQVKANAFVLSSLDFFGQPLIQHWVPRGACVIKMGLNKGIQKQPSKGAI